MHWSSGGGGYSIRAFVGKDGIAFWEFFCIFSVIFIIQSNAAPYFSYSIFSPFQFKTKCNILILT